jgi:hypothetical protein
VKRRVGRFVSGVLLVGAVGCTLHPDVASLTVAIPRRVPADAMRTATSRGWREGESCRFWLLGIPFGLPQVDEAMERALVPVHGVLMRDVTVESVHPVYGLFGWHCYELRGEAFG